jgi:hypothetical protein
VIYRSLRVIGTENEPIESRYLATAPFGPEQLRLWVESTKNGVTQLSGNYRLASEDQFGVLGTLVGDSVTLTVLLEQDARLKWAELRGRVQADGSLAVTFRDSTAIRRTFFRAPPIPITP